VSSLEVRHGTLGAAFDTCDWGANCSATRLGSLIARIQNFPDKRHLSGPDRASANPRGIFILCKGSVKLSICASDGKTLILKIAEAGEVLGLSAAVAGIQGHPDWATSTWTQYLDSRSGDYRKANFVFNGDFEANPVPVPFDWQVAQLSGVDASRDCTIAWSGKCSFRISFDGTVNVDGKSPRN